MAIITTKSLADPKPAIQFNYAGQPMREGDAYNGRSENASVTPPVAPQPKRKSKGKVSAWTAEKRAAYSSRMRDWHAKRKAAQAQP
jgi:hypothetical protein